MKEYLEASLQSEIIINTNRLTKAYGKLVAVNDLHLQVMRGDVFGFLGPNGAGKSTTIRMLLGLVRPTAGRAIIFGMDTAYQMPVILRHVGAIVEMPVFYPYLSGIDNLRVVAAASGMVSGRANQRRIEEVLELVELKKQATMAYRKYSLGMKQRLGIASALLIDPELVLLDEPTNGLDPAGMYEIRQLIQRLAALGKTIFISSHLLNEVQQVCNRVAILQKGNLIKQGNVHELLRGQEQVQVRLRDADELERAQAVLEQARANGADWIGSIHLEKDRQGQETLHINALRSFAADINRLLACKEIFAAELHPYEGSLEEVYLQLTTPATATGERLGMAALAGGTELLEQSEQPLQADDDIADVPGQRKGGR
ncbi:MAG TPA: ABC transporter ATP-binding protein [Ktedonobacteraceae bacterium]|nr:ABC transporter ATP-binding protein [Ktedonobacteraceae bacterium]